MAVNQDYQRSRLIDASKLALLQYAADSKAPTLHSYNQRSMFWDREHIYNENLMLKNKIKEMEDINTKTKTRLLRTEKEAAEIVSRSKGKSDAQLLRSISTQQLKSDSHLKLLKWRVDSLKEQEHTKKMIFMKQKIRELKEEVERQRVENNELRKTMKYTRMSELQAENKELIEEILRLKKVLSQNSKARDEMLNVFAKQKQDFRLSIRREIQTQAQLKKELKKAHDVLRRLKDQQTNGNKWINQIKKLEFQNWKLKEQLNNASLPQNPFTFKSKEDIGNPENSATILSENFPSVIMHKSLPQQQAAPASQQIIAEEIKPEGTKAEEMRQEEIRQQELKYQEEEKYEQVYPQVKSEQARAQVNKSKEAQPKAIKSEQIKAQVANSQEIKPQEESKSKVISPEVIKPEAKPEVKPEVIKSEVKPEVTKPKETKRAETAPPQKIIEDVREDQHEPIFEVAIDESNKSHEEDGRPGSRPLNGEANVQARDQAFEQKPMKPNEAPKQGRSVSSSPPNANNLQKKPESCAKPQAGNPPSGHVSAESKKQTGRYTGGQLLEQIYENDEEQFQNLMQEEIEEA